MVRVWDVFVRVFHWTVVVTFFVAYFTEDDLLTLHVWAGYVLGVFVVMRIAWGFVGPKHARFTDFVCGPIKVWTYLVDLVAFRAKRYLGHSPAGGAMALALLIGLLAVVWTGLELYAVEENAGPLASISPTTAAPGLLVLVSEDDNEDEEREEFWEELHEWLSNLVFVLVILHIAGVLLASIVHGENLSRAMVTGLKRPED
jgi:cytochrome b